MAVRAANVSIRGVGVIVVMGVGGQALQRAGAEHAGVFGSAGHLARRALAADVGVDADDVAGAVHDEVQIVGNQQHAAIQAGADVFYQLVKGRLAREVHPLHGLVKHQKIGLAQDGAGDEHPLQLAAGEALNGAVQASGHAGFGKGGEDFRRPGGGGQAHEAGHRHGQGGIEAELLRHIANLQPRGPFDAPFGQRQYAQGQADGGGLAAAVGADESDDLAPVHGEGDMADKPAIGRGAIARVMQGEQGPGGGFALFAVLRHLAVPAGWLKRVSGSIYDGARDK